MIQCARWHVDKHIVKMITEYCQPVYHHRILDGQMYYGKTKNGRNIKRWMLPDYRENVLFKNVMLTIRLMYGLRKFK